MTAIEMLSESAPIFKEPNSVLLTLRHGSQRGDRFGKLELAA
jgi:hypothetical protein